MKVRTAEVQALINEFGGSIWEEDGDWPVEDWAYEVACNYTRLGYWEQVLNKREGGPVRTADVEAHIERCGDFWGEDPLVPIGDWRGEVAGDSTRVGYWEYALENRPRPWALKNDYAVSPSHMFWNGTFKSTGFWSDLNSAKRLADDELADAMNKLSLPDSAGATWFHVPLAELMDSADPIDAMTEALTAFVMRNELPHQSADDLLMLEVLDDLQRIYLEQFVAQWEQAIEMDADGSSREVQMVGGEPSLATVHLDLRVDYELNGEDVADMARNLRSAIEREVGNGALTGVGPAEVDEYSMDVIDSPTELEELAVKRLIKNGYDPLMAKAVASFGMMPPTDFIESIAGSVAQLRKEG